MDVALYRYAHQLKEELYQKYEPRERWVTSKIRRDFQRQAMNFVAEKLYYAVPYRLNKIMEEHEILRSVFGVSESSVIRALNMQKYYNAEAKWHYWKSDIYGKGTVHKVRSTEWYKTESGLITLRSLYQIEEGEEIQWRAERYATKAELFGSSVTIVEENDDGYRIKIAQDGGLNTWCKYELMGEYYE